MAGKELSHKDMKELEDSIRNCIRSGLNKFEIVQTLAPQYSGNESVVQSSVDATCDEYGDYELIQFFMKSKIISDKVAEDDKLYMYDPVSRQIKDIARNRLISVISPKIKWDHRRYTCDFVYNPLDCFKLNKIDGIWQYNLYEPPAWYSDYFYNPIRSNFINVPVLPALYDKFFRHLVNNHEPSYLYLLDWLANMLQSRNFCILTTIGSQGIGKGLLGDIMRELVGDVNWAKTDNKIVDKDFNGQIVNKRLTYLNELKIKTVEQENKLKALIDSTLEVEKKGVDAKQIVNYSSIYVSSNNLDAIRIPSDDRRFSIVMLTDTKLINVMSQDEIRSLIEDKDLIKQLGFYLLGRKVDEQKMMRVFKSDRTELIRSSSLSAWQEWFIEEFAPDMSNKTMTIREVTEAVENEFGSSCRPGRGALTSLEQFYPDVFKIRKVQDPKNKNKRIWIVEFT